MASIWRLNDQNFWVLSQNDESDQTTKVIKAQWIASIWRQNDLKSWVTSLNYKSNQITMDCIDLTSKQSKMLSYVAKLRKWSNYNQIDAMHYNLMTFVGLRCFECFATYLNILDCFDVKSMQSIVIWLLL